MASNPKSIYKGFFRYHTKNQHFFTKDVERKVMSRAMKITYLNKYHIQLAYECVNGSYHKGKRTRNFLIIKTFLTTGLRVSELISLCPNNIDFNNCSLTVEGKGRKIRTIDISLDTTQSLKVYIDSQNIRPNQSIFALSRQAIRNITRRYAGCKPHTLRHTYAINLYRKTKNIRFVQKQLGHKRLDTTEIYLNFVEYTEEKKKLSELYE